MAEINAANTANAQKRSIWVAWIDEMTVLPRPEPDTPEAKVLIDAKITTAAKWSEFRLWCIWLAVNTGKYGEGMNWSQLTLAEQHPTVGVKRVRQWLQVAEGLGLIRVVKPATGYAPAVYGIAEFWKADEPPRLVRSLDDGEEWPPKRRPTYLETMAERT